MPCYDWRCEHCGRQVEVVRSVQEALQPVFCDCGVPMVQQLSAAYVSPDIAPYRAVAGDRAGQFITSRKEHREFLKRNHLREVGNEPVKSTKKMRQLIESDAARRDFREQMRPVVREALRTDKRRGT